MFLIEFQRTAERLMALRTTTLAALRLTVEGHGDAGLDAFMVERVDTVLALRGYPEELKLNRDDILAALRSAKSSGQSKNWRASSERPLHLQDHVVS